MIGKAGATLGKWGQFQPDFFEKMKVGMYYLSLGNGAATTISTTANRVYAVEFFTPRRITVDRIAIHVSTLAAGKIVRLAIYKDGDDLYPGDLVVDGGEVSVASTGVKAAIISEQLEKGIYWLAYVSDGTPALRAAYLGSGVLGFPNTSLLTKNCWYYKDTGGTTMADPFPSGALIAETDYHPLAGLRIASLD